MSACWERYPNGGGELLLALALADHADDNGENVYPSVASLMGKTRQSKRTVQYQLRKMEEAGWLQLVAHEGGGRGRAREYRINPDWIKGADIAPISKDGKGANSAPFESGKDADIAPFGVGERAQDLHPSEPERVQSETQRVQSTTQKGATAIAPEPSGTVIEPSVKNTDSRPPQKSKTKSKPMVSAADLVKDHGVDPDVAAQFLAVRKAKSLPLTVLAMDALVREWAKAGLSVPGGVCLCATRGWAAFKASWNWQEDPDENRISRGHQTGGQQRTLSVAERVAIANGLNPDGSPRTFDG